VRLESLLDAPGLPRFDLPTALEEAYGSFGLAAQTVYANFVASVDGIVALPEMPRSSALISGGDPADRFVVALLRACADAVLIGAGTFRTHHGPWTADKAYPDAAAEFAEFRRSQGMVPEPTLVVVTGSGRLDSSPSKLRDAIVATTAQAAGRARDGAGKDAEVVVVGDSEPLDAADVITLLSGRGYRRILTEGGPGLMGQLLKAGAVDELFLTLSPVLTGGGQRGPRPTLTGEIDLLSSGPVPARLLSARAHGSYLFLRYNLQFK
jgi:riboflavin biosynthesis pyrimidine reductase